MGTPYPLVSVLTVHQQLLVDSLAVIRHSSGVQRPSVFITFDKVHANKQGDIIYDGGKPFFVGGLTRTDLTGALRSYAELRRVSKVDESDLADGFLTVVLHDEGKTITHGCLIGVIPIGAETKEFIYAMVLKYAHLSFDANARLVPRERRWARGEHLGARLGQGVVEGHGFNDSGGLQRCSGRAVLDRHRRRPSRREARRADGLQQPDQAPGPPVIPGRRRRHGPAWNSSRRLASEAERSCICVVTRASS